MFENSVFESAGGAATHRGATTIASAALQTMLLGLAVLLPLIYTEALPRAQMVVLSLPAPPPGPPPRALPPDRHPRPSSVQTELERDRVLVPRGFPDHPAQIRDEEPPAVGPTGPASSFVPGGTGPADSPITSILKSGQPTRPVYDAPKRLALGGNVSIGHLIHRVEPTYPEIARRARIQGDVRVRAVIARDGSVQNLTVVDGNPFLAQAAMDAVSHWRYEPFLLNGQPIEVDTEVTIRFRLAN